MVIYTLKCLHCCQLQVYLSICDVLVDTRHWTVNYWGLTDYFHDCKINWFLLICFWYPIYLGAIKLYWYPLLWTLGRLNINILCDERIICAWLYVHNGMKKILSPLFITNYSSLNSISNLILSSVLCSFGLNSNHPNHLFSRTVLKKMYFVVFLLSVCQAAYRKDGDFMIGAVLPISTYENGKCTKEANPLGKTKLYSIFRLKVHFLFLYILMTETFSDQWINVFVTGNT